MIEGKVPNSGKDDSNEKEDKSCYKNTTAVMLFGLAELTRTVIGI